MHLVVLGTVLSESEMQNKPCSEACPLLLALRPENEAIMKNTQSARLQRYREYLQSYYEARALAPADKFLPTMNAPYIDLAKKFYKDRIHQYVSPLCMEDLLSPVKDKQPIKFVLVEGPPGIGKSTFAWEACRRWDEILRNYHAVVLLKLREKWVLNATSLADLFRYPSEPQFSNSIAAELDWSQGRNLLLVLDGFDEVSHKFHQDSVIVKAFLVSNYSLLVQSFSQLDHQPSRLFIKLYSLELIKMWRLSDSLIKKGFSTSQRFSVRNQSFMQSS